MHVRLHGIGTVQTPTHFAHRATHVTHNLSGCVAGGNILNTFSPHGMKMNTVWVLHVHACAGALLATQPSVEWQLRNIPCALLQVAG